MIRQVATTTVLVLGFLVVMLLGGRLIRYFGMAAQGGLDVGVLFTLIGYNLPYFLELILPLAFFIGLMLTFGRLYADHEMAVINGSGISRGKLSRLLIPLVLVLFVVQIFVSLVAKPWGVAKAANIWQEQSVAQVFELIRPREFISSGEYHLYVGAVGENRESLHDVIIIQMHKERADKDDGKAVVHNEVQLDKEISKDVENLPNHLPKRLISSQDTLIFAKSATQVDSADGTLQLDLHQGRRYEVNPSSQKYSQVGFEKYRITLAAKPEADGKEMRIDGVATRELLTRLADTDKKVPAMAEIGYRLSLPWLMVIALMLAAPLAQTRPRQGRWLKLIPAVFIFVANVLILISLKDSIAKGKLSVWAYPVAVVGLLGFALYLNYHERLVARLRLKTERA